MRFLFSLLLLTFATLAHALQDPAPVTKAVEDFLRVQTKGLPGKASFSVGAIDANNQLSPCPSLEVELPPGGRLWGHGRVLVRCLAEGGWSMFVSVHVRVRSTYYATARPLARGQMVRENDLQRLAGDLTELPAGVITEPAQAVGQVLTMPIPAGRPLRSDMLQVVTVVQQNQTVKIVSRGPGFTVANEGRALTNASAGQVVQVRLGNGQVLSGIARPGGIVEVTH